MCQRASSRPERGALLTVFKEGRASLVAQWVKSLPAVWESRVWSPAWEDPLEKEMATHCSVLAWKISWMEEPGRLTVHEITKCQTWLSNFIFTFTHCNEDIIEQNFCFVSSLSQILISHDFMLWKSKLSPEMFSLKLENIPQSYNCPYCPLIYLCY